MRDKVHHLTLTEKSSLIIADDCVLEKVDIDGHTVIKGTHAGEKVTL